jgi:hypothetical protein
LPARRSDVIAEAGLQQARLLEMNRGRRPGDNVVYLFTEIPICGDVFMTTYFRSFVCLALVFVCLAIHAASAAAQHFDVFITNLADTKTGIGGADVDGGAFNIDTRVFESVLVIDGTPAGLHVLPHVCGRRK